MTRIISTLLLSLILQEASFAQFLFSDSTVNSTSIGLRIDKLAIKTITLSLEQKIGKNHLFSVMYEKINEGPQIWIKNNDDMFFYKGYGYGATYKYLILGRSGPYIGISFRHVEKSYDNRWVFYGYGGRGIYWADFHEELKSKSVSKSSAYLQGGYLISWGHIQLEGMAGIGFTSLYSTDKLIKYGRTPPSNWDGRKPGVINTHTYYPSFRFGLIMGIGWNYKKKSE